jgi:hypothetical protein
VKVGERLGEQRKITQVSYIEVQYQEVKLGIEKYRVEVSNRFEALKDLDCKVDINKAWEMIRDHNNFSQRNA